MTEKTKEIADHQVKFEAVLYSIIPAAAAGICLFAASKEQSIIILGSGIIYCLSYSYVDLLIEIKKLRLDLEQFKKSIKK